MLRKLRRLKTPVKWGILGTSGAISISALFAELRFSGSIISHTSPLLGLVLLIIFSGFNINLVVTLVKELVKDFGGENNDE